MSRHDMLLHLSTMDDQSLNQFCLQYGIGPEYNPTPPGPNHRVTDCPDGFIAVYTKFFEVSNLRLPFSFFFLEFLKQYRVTIAQLSPLGVMKLCHFEIVCRALGGEPSLPLFRRFFHFARFGHWYTVQKLKHTSPGRGYKSWVPPSGFQWKDSVFWVSADAVPFKMHWRQHHEPLTVIHPHSEVFDSNLYRLLVKHPMPPQPFPEHVLVMTGVSRNWPYVNAEPVLKHGDEEMGLLKYIEMKGVGVTLTTRSLAEHEDNVLDRTRGICYENRPSDHVAEIEGDDVNTIGRDDVNIHPKRLLLGSEIEKHSHSERRKSQRSEPEASGSSSKKLKLVKEESNVILVVSSSSDSGHEANERTNDAPKPDRVGCLEQLVNSVPELLKWQERKAKTEGRLRDKNSRYRARMCLERTRNLKLVKKVKKLKKLKRMSLVMGKETMKMVAEKTVEHQNVVEALRKEFQDARLEIEEKLEKAHEELEQQRGMVEKLKGELEVEKDARTQERVSLEKLLGCVSSERRWLIQEGFEYVINRLHRSGEYNRLLGAVQTNLWSSGAHYGVVEGYARCKAGAVLEDVSLYKPEAYREFLKAVHELEHTRFPYVVALSRCADGTLDELKEIEPVGMEDGEDEVTDGGDQTK